MRPPVRVRQTIADRLVGYFNPTAGVKRLQSRMMLDAAGGYVGGRRDRRQTRNWRPGEGSANADLLPDLPDLRSRSRDLERNMPIAAGAITTTVTNVVGEGLGVTPTLNREILKLGDEQAEAWEAAAAREFGLACETIDFGRAQTFYGQQATVLRSYLSSGDVFAVRRYRKDPGDVYGTKVQLVEADRCSNPGRHADRPGMVGGVAFNSDGVATGYSFSDRHPGDMLINPGQLNWTTVPARDEEGRPLVLHVYDRLRPDQARGAPALAPVIEALRVLGNFVDSETTAALISSYFTVFVETQNGADDNPIVGDKDSSTGDNEVKLGPGAVITMQPGDKVQTAASNRPGPNFDSFVQSFCRWIGVGLDLPYEVLIKHFTASYSASRAALETAWQSFRMKRARLVRVFCQPVYEWVIYEAIAAGRLSAPGFFDDPLLRRAWCGAMWVGPARISLDPVKDANADQVNLGNRTTSRQMIIQTRFGGTFDQVRAQLAKEERRLTEDGLGTPEPSSSEASEPGDESEDETADDQPQEEDQA
jgi:lambda family phage portal protein